MRLPFPVSRAARLHLVEQWPALAAAVRVNLGGPVLKFDVGSC
jgi:hypothetical protein